MFSFLDGVFKFLAEHREAVAIGVTAAAFVATTALILLCGGPIGWAVGIGLFAGALFGIGTYWLLNRTDDSPQVQVVSELNISFAFTPGEDHLALPYQCKVYNTTTTTTTTTTRWRSRSKTEKSSTYRLIKAQNGREFQQKFEAELEHLARENKNAHKTIRSLSLYDEPYPGETTLEMMRIKCDEYFPETNFVEYPFAYRSK